MTISIDWQFDNFIESLEKSLSGSEWSTERRDIRGIASTFQSHLGNFSRRHRKAIDAAFVKKAAVIALEIYGCAGFLTNPDSVKSILKFSSSLANDKTLPWDARRAALAIPHVLYARTANVGLKKLIQRYWQKIGHTFENMTRGSNTEPLHPDLRKLLDTPLGTGTSAAEFKFASKLQLN